ncbi:RNAse P Rpr2/Rpp21/SNM1 subunit domain-containing protein [Geranomyces variabilis]|nr:RNAse P Rpr2/Rpp21/SNM1 subunit domain-containing protein [Geranomyces variabilis]KAJ3137081.1 Ribonuclease P protein subunit p21 [Geranomyces variabilis]
MGKKDKRNGGGGGGGGRNNKDAPHRIDNLEAYHRLNFLHQAAVLVAGLPVSNPPPPPPPPAASSATTGKNPPPNSSAQQRHATTCSNLSRFYIRTRRAVERKLVLRSHPAFKRSLCKHCKGLLLPGVSASVKVKVEQGRPIVLTSCGSCGTRRHLPAGPDGDSPRLHVDRAVVELDANPKEKNARDKRDTPKTPAAGVQEGGDAMNVDP